MEVGPNNRVMQPLQLGGSCLDDVDGIVTGHLHAMEHGRAQHGAPQGKVL
jgi:hypothetical protein